MKGVLLILEDKIMFILPQMGNKKKLPLQEAMAPQIMSKSLLFGFKNFGGKFITNFSRNPRNDQKLDHITSLEKERKSMVVHYPNNAVRDAEFSPPLSLSLSLYLYLSLSLFLSLSPVY
eukprot:sb/3476273/